MQVNGKPDAENMVRAKCIFRIAIFSSPSGSEKDYKVNDRESKTTSVHICSFERCKRT